MSTAHLDKQLTLNKRFKSPVIGYDPKDGGGLLPIAEKVSGYDLRQAKANAARIVLTWNAHDDLVAALKDSNDALIAAFGNVSNPDAAAGWADADAFATYQSNCAALAKAVA